MADWDDKADTLFKQHTISEIQASHNKISQDIEKKRENLRTMVGGKYRQLLEAADDMIAMAKISAQVVASIDGLKQSCVQLRHSGPSARSLEEALPVVKSSTDPLFVTAVQVKLLLDAPEKIWGALESEDYELAMYTYCLARYVHGTLVRDSQVARQFPLLKTQWNNVMEFEQRIKDHVNTALSSHLVSLATARSALVTLAMLEGHSLEQLLKTFLDRRVAAVQLLGSEFSEESLEEEVWQLCQSVIHTCHLVTILFHPDGGLEKEETEVITVTDRLRQLNGHEGLTVSQEWQQTHLINDTTAAMPDSVKTFTLDYQNGLEELSRSRVQACMQAWLESIRTIMDETAPKCLAKAATVDVMIKLGATILSRTMSMTAPERVLHLFGDMELAALTKTGLLELASWNSVCQDILGQPLDVFDVYLQKHIRKQVQDILAQLAFHGVEKLAEDLNAILTHPLEDDSRDLLDVSSYCWNPERLTEYDFGTVADTSKTKVPLVQGCREAAHGIFAKSAAALRSFETTFHGVLDKSQSYIQAQTPTRAASILDHNDQADAEQPVMARFLQSTAEKGIAQLLRKIAAISTQTHSELSEDVPLWHVGSRLACIARCLHALATSCEPLEQLMLAAQGSNKANIRARGKKTESQERLRSLQSQLRIQAEACLEPWIETLIDQHANLLKRCLMQLPLVDMSSQLPGWSSFNVEEISEHGTKQTSTIYLPMTPSSALLNAMCGIASEVARCGVSRLHQQLHMTITKQTRLALAAVYDSLLQAREDATLVVCQDGLLLLLVDVEFLSDITTTSSDKDSLHVMRKRIRAAIDPFDLDVYDKHLTPLRANVYHRSETLLGLFASIQPMHQHDRGTLSTTEKHNCLAVAKPPPRFASLPIGGNDSNQPLSESATYMPTATTKHCVFADVHQDHLDMASFYALLANP